LIPAAGNGLPGGAVPPPMPPPGADPTNPFQSPQAPGLPAAGPLGSPFQPAQLEVGDIFGRTWEIFKQNIGMCIGLVVVVGVIGMAANMGVGAITNGIRAATRNEGAAMMFNLVGILAVSVLNVFLQMGVLRIFLKIARGQPAEFGELFAGGPQFLPFLGVGILFGLMVGLGAMLCLVPGIILMLMFWPARYLVLDRNAPVFESFSMASSLMAGNKMNVFLIGLLGLLLMFAGALPCLLGLIIVAPYLTLMGVVVYLTLSGEPTVAMHPAVQ
jgi:hypothetical protein